MLSRNLLYTAVTRGKRLVVLVCDPRALQLALSRGRPDEPGRRGGPEGGRDRPRDDPRRTRLAARLADRLAERLGRR
jgi:hypothetical protein